MPEKFHSHPLKLTPSLLLFFSLASCLFPLSPIYAWTGPSASPPNNNTSAPINVGSGDQTKTGGLLNLYNLWVNSGLGVTGGISAGTTVSSPQFCIGGSCISSWPSPNGGNASTLNGLGSSSFLKWNTWENGDYYGTNGDIYMGWAGNWLSTILNSKQAAGSYVPQNAWWGSTYYGSNGDIYLGYWGTWLSTKLSELTNGYANSAGSAPSPSGTQCGYSMMAFDEGGNPTPYGAIQVLCMGHTPYYSCPSGYTRQGGPGYNLSFCTAN